MTTSGSTVISLTANQVITQALRKLNATPLGTPVDMGQATDALNELNSMLKDWQTMAPQIFRLTESTVTLTAGTYQYSLATDNPLRVYEMRYTYSDGHDLPMKRLTRTQYKRFPLKNATGIPTQFYFDPQTTTNNLYIWTAPVDATGHLTYTYVRRFQVCQTLANDIDVPEEWEYAVYINLAKRLLPTYGVRGEEAQRIENEAARAEATATAFARPTHVKFSPASTYRA